MLDAVGRMVGRGGQDSLLGVGQFHGDAPWDWLIVMP
jgi:hypothetical protein